MFVEKFPLCVANQSCTQKNASFILLKQSNFYFIDLTYTVWIQKRNEFNNWVCNSKDGEISISDNFKKGEMPLGLINHVNLIIFEKNSHLYA